MTFVDYKELKEFLKNLLVLLKCERRTVDVFAAEENIDKYLWNTEIGGAVDEYEADMEEWEKLSSCEGHPFPDPEGFPGDSRLEGVPTDPSSLNDYKAIYKNSPFYVDTLPLFQLADDKAAEAFADIAVGIEPNPYCFPEVAELVQQKLPYLPLWGACNLDILRFDCNNPRKFDGTQPRRLSNAKVERYIGLMKRDASDLRLNVPAHVQRMYEQTQSHLQKAKMVTALGVDLSKLIKKVYEKKSVPGDVDKEKEGKTDETPAKMVNLISVPVKHHKLLLKGIFKREDLLLQIGDGQSEANLDAIIVDINRKEIEEEEEEARRKLEQEQMPILEEEEEDFLEDDTGEEITENTGERRGYYWPESPFISVQEAQKIWKETSQDESVFLQTFTEENWKGQTVGDSGKTVPQSEPPKKKKSCYLENKMEKPSHFESRAEKQQRESENVARAEDSAGNAKQDRTPDLDLHLQCVSCQSMIHAAIIGT